MHCPCMQLAKSAKFDWIGSPSILPVVMLGSNVSKISTQYLVSGRFGTDFNCPSMANSATRSPALCWSRKSGSLAAVAKRYTSSHRVATFCLAGAASGSMGIFGDAADAPTDKQVVFAALTADHASGSPSCLPRRWARTEIAYLVAGRSPGIMARATPSRPTGAVNPTKGRSKGGSETSKETWSTRDAFTSLLLTDRVPAATEATPVSSQIAP
mmetsp:Transcript_62186/g.157056  ORF Transcript_62186/g.157056 Transcript_62186/m.157056 type:complete len:213 (+) Transcript_62186:676-1314(+)